MRVTILTSVNKGWVTESIISAVMNSHQVTIVTIDRSSLKFRESYLKSLFKKIRKKGIRWFVKRMIEKPRLDKCRYEWDFKLKEYAINGTWKKASYDEIFVESVNGVDTANKIKETEPDVLIQAEAGILKENIFSIPKIATLNMHHGIAPKIRGGDSIFWGMYYGMKDWVGVTVHRIDKGIDTGDVYKREVIEYEYGDHPAYVFYKATEAGIELLLKLLEEFKANGSSDILDTSSEKSTYQSFYSASQYNKLKANNWKPVESINV